MENKIIEEVKTDQNAIKEIEEKNYGRAEINNRVEMANENNVIFRDIGTIINLKKNNEDIYIEKLFKLISAENSNDKNNIFYEKI